MFQRTQDESMHSGAEVDAFQAALNRDIGGDASTSRPSDSDSGIRLNFLLPLFLLKIFVYSVFSLPGSI